MQVCSNFFSAFDAFYVTFTPSLNPNENKVFYKSAVGGIVSLLIYIFGFFYGIGLMIKWFDNEMVMKISSQEENYDRGIYQEIFEIQNFTNYFEVKIYSNIPDDEMIDPFKEDEIILLPIMINNTSDEYGNILNYHNLENKNLQINLEDSLYENVYILLFVSCIGNEELLNINQTCASQEKSDEFFTIPGLELWMTHHTSTIDIYSNEVITLKSYTTYLLQNTLSQYTTIEMQYTYTEIRQGFLFQSTDSYMLKGSYHYNDQIAQAGYLDTYFSAYTLDGRIFNKVYGAAYLTSMNNINHVVAEYPTISEVLASIGSIFQTLLLVRYVFVILNRHKMVEDFKTMCRGIYYPEINQVTKKGRGKKTKYFLIERELEPKSYEQFLISVDKMLDEKLNYANLIYEISRIQAVLQEITPHDVMKASHFKQSALQLEMDGDKNLYRIKHKEQDDKKTERQQLLDPQLDLFAFNYSRSQLCIDSKREQKRDSKRVAKRNANVQSLELPIHRVGGHNEIQIEFSNLPSPSPELKP